MGPREKATMLTFPSSSPGSPQKPSTKKKKKAQYRRSWTWAPCLGPMSLKYHMWSNQKNRGLSCCSCPWSLEALLTGKHFASSQQWPRSPLLLLQTSRGGTIFPSCLVLGLGRGSPWEASRDLSGSLQHLCRVMPSRLVSDPLSPQAARHAHPIAGKSMFTDLH